MKRVSLPRSLSLDSRLRILVFPMHLTAQAQTTLPIMPLPSHVVQGQGQFLIDGNFGVALQGYTEPRLQRAKQRFLVTLSRETGIPLWRQAQFNPAQLRHQNWRQPAIPSSSWVRTNPITWKFPRTMLQLSAANPLGILHGLQTFLQLVRTTPQGFSVPVVTIDDQPRFPWRGLMIDVGRHFIPVPVIERDLDANGGGQAECLPLASFR